VKAIQYGDNPRPLGLPQRLTAFTRTVDAAGRVLMVRHERLGVVRWELPGGHVELDETVTQGAERETFEETGVRVQAVRLVAECHHHWRGRTVGIQYFHATPVDVADAQSADARIRAIDWIDPRLLDPTDTSALAWPVVRDVAHDDCRPTRPLRFEATHHETEAGWEPVVTRSWCLVDPCRRLPPSSIAGMGS
jgi:ADP-ribose pyrophosphatase YjhB (NUDIX family)